MRLDRQFDQPGPAPGGGPVAGGEDPLGLDLSALLWMMQVGDSQFPSGAYAHSAGLEGLVQRGFVQNPDDLEAYLRSQVVPNLLGLELPLLRRAHPIAAAGDRDSLREFDDELEAWKLAAEMRQASRQIGSRRLDLVRKLDPDPLLDRYAEGGAPCHQITVCALEFRREPVAVPLAAHAFQSVSGQATAAMKLIRLGQERCQAIVRRTVRAIAPRVAAAAAAPPGSGPGPGWFSPLAEIASMRHALAHERLFIS